MNLMKHLLTVFLCAMTVASLQVRDIRKDIAGPEHCRQGTLLTDFFSCVKADNVPLFARHGLLLGSVREKSFIHFKDHVDNDFDVGFLPEDESAIRTYFNQGKVNECFAKKNIRVQSVEPFPQYSTCVAPSKFVQQQIMATKDLVKIPDSLDLELRNLCTPTSKVTGFSAGLSGLVDGVPVTIALHAAVFPKTATGYMYDRPCVKTFNCANEVRMWYLYGMPDPGPGKPMGLRFPAEAFKPMKSVEFVLSQKVSSVMMVPNDADKVLTVLYGSTWRQPINKYDASEGVAKTRSQTYLCG